MSEQRRTAIRGSPNSRQPKTKNLTTDLKAANVRINVAFPDEA